MGTDPLYNDPPPPPVITNSENEYKLFSLKDPHFYGNADKTLLQSDGWVQWKHLDEVFKSDSFYNFCLPQLRSEEK